MKRPSENDPNARSSGVMGLTGLSLWFIAFQLNLGISVILFWALATLGEYFIRNFHINAGCIHD
jgi:hypothetical protein